jgi:hypothetical protein
MIENQEVMNSNNFPTFGWRPSDKAQICMDVFFIRSMSNTNFAVMFLPKPPVDRRSPPVVYGLQL